MSLFETGLTILAAETEGQGPGLGNMFWFYILAIFAALYFIVLRPQRRQETERKEKLNAIAKGDTVRSIGGILGTVVGVDQNNDVIVVEVDKNTRLRFVREAISTVEKKGKKGANAAGAKNGQAKK